MWTCKRAQPPARPLAALAIGAVCLLAGRAHAAPEGMRILTFVPGVAHGRMPVAVDLGASPPPAELLLNGTPACRITAARETCFVDLGPAPRVALLELVRRDAGGRVVERVRRWVNKPSDARAEVNMRSDCTNAAGPCTLRFSWSHESAIAPQELTVTIDGAKTYQGEPRDVPVPFARGSAARVIAAELLFRDGERVTQTILIGSGTSSAVEAPLSAVPLVFESARPGAPPPSTLAGRVVASIEPGEAEVLFVVAPSARAKLQALTKSSQKTFGKNAGRMEKALLGLDHIIYFTPLGMRAAYSSATRVSDRMFRLRGYDCTPKHDFRERTLALPCVDAELLGGEQYRLAATVASATFNRAAVPRRRAVVVVLGDDEVRDESAYGPVEVRRYLSEILVPLEVWRLGRVSGDGWPAGRRIANVEDLVRGWESLRAGLDAQRIAWIAEDLDPSVFTLGPDDAGLSLAGRRGPGQEGPGVEIASSEVASRAREPAKIAHADRTGRVAAAQEISLVSLDANVTDKSGRPVRGLTAADFDLFVGGRPVAISNFSEIGAGGSSSSGATSESTPPRPTRRIAFFVDRLTLGDPRRSHRFFKSLEDFVEKSVGPGDEATILTFDTSLAVRLPFTGDKASIRAALETLAVESARPPSTFTGTESAERLVDEIAQAQAEMAARESGRAQAAAPPTMVPVAEAKSMDPTVAAEARMLAAQEWLRTRRKVAALRAVLAQLGGTDGRKILVVASHRLSRNPGLEFFLSKRLDRDVIVPSEAREMDAQSLLLSLAKAANAYGVTLHGLYPEAGGNLDLSVVERTNPTLTGQVANHRGMDIDANESAGLHLAVDDTGGRVGVGAEAAGDTLSSMAEDLETYYSIGFPPPAGASEKRIELRPKRAGLSVVTRHAFVERSASDRMSDRVISNLFGTRTAAAFEVTARIVSTTPAGKNGVRVSFEVKIPAAALALLPSADGRHARVSAHLAILDGGDVTSAPPVTREFVLPDGVSPDAAHFTYAGEVVTTSSPSVVSIGILDEASKEAGFSRIDAARPGKT